ncbi:hypothetical protein GQ600_17225 [Phytophthora cactorum]|nr:hypothetical protein GQ600_17225 [Phytophthora cactorum]
MPRFSNNSVRSASFAALSLSLALCNEALAPHFCQPPPILKSPESPTLPTLKTSLRDSCGLGNEEDFVLRQGLSWSGAEGAESSREEDRSIV